MAVATETKPTPGGNPFASIQDWMTGTSRWQWGHQCATKTIAVGRPEGSMATGLPSKEAPWTVGAVIPTAGSCPEAGNGGRGAPVIPGSPFGPTVAAPDAAADAPGDAADEGTGVEADDEEDAEGRGVEVDPNELEADATADAGVDADAGGDADAAEDVA